MVGTCCSEPERARWHDPVLRGYGPKFTSAGAARHIRRQLRALPRRADAVMPQWWEKEAQEYMRDELGIGLDRQLC